MIDLILAIIFSAMIPVLLKYAHKRDLADEVILTFNYVIALIFSLILMLLKIDSYKILLHQNNNLTALITIGLLTGLAYYGAFYFYQKSVKDNGVSLSIAVGKMGIIIPMLLSLFLWKEIPEIIQWIGIIISMVAIGVINISPKDFKGSKFKTSLLLFFVIGGLGDFFNKLFQVSVGSVYKDLFLAVVFGAALFASIFMTIKHKNITKMSILFGIMVGIPNMLTAFYLIKALSKMNATVVFPMYSGGAIMLSMLWSMFAFGEKLKLKEIVGIVMIILALVLINF